MLAIQYPESPEISTKTEIVLATEERHYEEQFHPDQHRSYQAVLVYGKIELKQFSKMNNSFICSIGAKY